VSESIQHLFLDCPMAKLVWGILCLTFGIRMPSDVGNLFGPWLRNFPKKKRNLILVGVVAFCWAIWISRNDIVFHKSHSLSILQVMFRGLTGSRVGPSSQRKRGGSF
jgi:hypothetical protein